MSRAAFDCVGPGLRPGQSVRRAEALCRRNYDYRRRLPHLQKNDHPLFVTFNTDRRWHLPPLARDIVLECCLHEHTKKFDLHAAVVMPDHVHLIYSPLRREDGWSYSLPEIMKAIKGRAARQINVALNRPGPVWQQEFSDHVLRSNDSLVDRVDYVCQNPVRAGLVRSESEYSWVWKGKDSDAVIAAGRARGLAAARPGLRPGPTYSIP